MRSASLRVLAHHVLRVELVLASHLSMNGVLEKKEEDKKQENKHPDQPNKQRSYLLFLRKCGRITALEVQGTQGGVEHGCVHVGVHLRALHGRLHLLTHGRVHHVFRGMHAVRALHLLRRERRRVGVARGKVLLLWG